MLELGNIYNMDNVQGLRLLDDECIDLTVTSPPYDDLRNYKGFSFDFENLAKELFRVTKCGGVVVWIVSDATREYSESGTSFRQALYFKDVGFNLFDTMIWCKEGGGSIGSNLCYTQNFEYMFVFSKGKPKSINLIKDRLNKSYNKKGNNTSNVPVRTRRLKNGDFCKETRPVTTLEYGLRNNWWYLCPHQQEGSSWHPAVFPELLVRDHVISWSNEGDVVLDPFMGSGTTAKVARALGRRFIGFEISKEYCDLANKRLEDSKTLFDL